MKVCHVISDLQAGGAERMLERLVLRTTALGIDNTIVTLRPAEGAIREALEAAGVRVRVFAIQPMSLGALVEVGSLWRWFRRTRPDIVQTWMYHANVVGGLVARAAGRSRVVWNIRTGAPLQDVKPETLWVARLGAMSARWLSAAIVANAEAGRRAHVALGYPADRFHVVANGFDVNVHKPDAAARSSLRCELGVPDHAMLIGLVANFRPVKDHSGFLTAAGQLSRHRPDVHFVLAGEGVTPSTSDLVSRIEALRLTHRVHLLGLRSDTARIFAGLDVLTLNSRREGFPNVLGEAMACAVPCVTTDVGDAALIVGDTGIVVKPGDPAALADAWRTLLDMDEEARRDLGRRARERVIAHYALDRIVDEYLTLYRAVIDG